MVPDGSSRFSTGWTGSSPSARTTASTSYGQTSPASSTRRLARFARSGALVAARLSQNRGDPRLRADRGDVMRLTSPRTGIVPPPWMRCRRRPKLAPSTHGGARVDRVLWPRVRSTGHRRDAGAPTMPWSSSAGISPSRPARALAATRQTRLPRLEARARGHLGGALRQGTKYPDARAMTRIGMAERG